MNTNLHTEQQTLILDFHQNLYKTVIAKQYDKGSRFVPIQCTADGAPFPLDPSYIVEVKVLTPDHRALLEDSATIQDDGSLLLELTENMLYCPGKAKVEIVIYDAANQQRLSPMNFDLLIEGSVYDDDRVTASDEFNALTDYVFKVGGLSDTVHEHISETNLHIADNVRHITEAERTKWDNVLEGYIYNDTFYSDSEHTAEITGETGKIYIDLETNKTYRWSGSAFVVISETLALGETPSSAYRGDRGKIAYDHAQTAHAPSNAEANQNAFSHIVADSTAIAAGSQTDTLTLDAGANITLTPDAENNVVTISSQDTVYTHPTTPGNRHIPGGGSSGQVLKWSEDGTAVWGNADDPDSVVTGIKGSAEATYRKGDVNITPENIGLGKTALIDLIYPVGSIYLSVNSSNPSTLFGGTWEQIKDTFLLAAGTTYAAGTTGGSKTVTLGVANLPSHNHTFTGTAANTGTESAFHTHSGTTSSNGSHSHNVAQQGYYTVQSGTSVQVKSRLQIPGDPGDVNGWTLEDGAHTHTMTTGIPSSNHIHSVTAKGTIGNTGSGSPFNIMPPYITVYIWKRIA